MSFTTAAVLWENSTITQGTSPMTSGRWPAPAKKKGERNIQSPKFENKDKTFFQTHAPGGML
jgi:hypothetical protein